MIELESHRRGLTIAYLIALLGLTLSPVPDVGVGPSQLDKLVHVLLFSGLAFLVYWNLYASVGWSFWANLAIATLLAAGLAGLIELIQSLLPYRHGELDDFVVGSIGALLGAAAAVRSFKRVGRAPA